MNSKKLFVNKRFVPNLRGNYTRYINRNGVLKRFIPTPLARKTVKEQDIWYDYSELPEELQEKLQDVTITIDSLPTKSKVLAKENNVIDSQAVTVYVTPNTPLLPIVGNLLPSDGTHAYTVIQKNDKLILEPIVVCWNCHWSELFTGQTPYGNNVFCLASELSEEQIKTFIDDIIYLKDVPEFLGWNMDDKEKQM